jgi:hypothetical protein
MRRLRAWFRAGSMHLRRGGDDLHYYATSRAWLPVVAHDLNEITRSARKLSMAYLLETGARPPYPAGKEPTSVAVIQEHAAAMNHLRADLILFAEAEGLTDLAARLKKKETTAHDHRKETI